MNRADEPGVMGVIASLAKMGQDVLYDPRNDSWALQKEKDLYKRLLATIRRLARGYEIEIYVLVMETSGFRRKSGTIKGRALVVSHPEMVDEVRQALKKGTLTPFILQSAGSYEHAICIPLVCGNDSRTINIGFVNLYPSDVGKSNPPTDEELTAVGHLAAIQIYNNRLAERWNTLAKSEHAASQAYDLKSVVRIGLEGPSVLELSSCWCYNVNNGLVKVVEYKGPKRLHRNGRARSLAISAIESRKHQLWVRGHLEASMSLIGQDENFFGSMVALPLIREDGQQFAFVYASRTPDRFSETELLFLRNMVTSVSHGINQLKLQEASYRDGIVGAASTALLHDLSAYSGIVKDSIDKLAGIKRYNSIIEDIKRAHDSIRQIVADVQSYVSRYDKDPSLSASFNNISHLIEEVVGSLNVEQRFPSNIKLTHSLAKKSFMANCDAVLLRTFVLGYIQNAILGIRKRLMEAEEGACGRIKVSTTVPRAADKVGEILIMDDGVGLEDPDRALSYRPKGAGFHVPFSRSIIQCYWRGRLEIIPQNEWGGVTVKVILPLVGS